MTKLELFKKYSINKSHSKWDQTQDIIHSIAMAYLIYDRFPGANDTPIKLAMDFMDKKNDPDFCNSLRWTVFGARSLFRTSRRMIYHHHTDIILQAA